MQGWLTPGNTPGHMAFLLAGAWCLTGDAAFHDPLSFAFPEAESVYDTQRARAVRTRQWVLGRLADERLKVIGYYQPWPASTLAGINPARHQPWPGPGRVERAAGSFRFIASASPGAGAPSAPRGSNRHRPAASAD